MVDVIPSLDDSPIDVSREVNFIWTIANRLRGLYQSDKYKNVIIPMTILRRFECALAATKPEVLKNLEEQPNMPASMLKKVSGLSFYNTSEFDLRKLTDCQSDEIADNLLKYISSFSKNAQDIFTELQFDKEIAKMNQHKRLFGVIQAFSELDLDPKTIDNMKMGYIFEDLIRRFSENAEAGDHYTGKDIIKLMAELLLAEGSDDVFEDGKVVTILDQAAGTGGMVSVLHDAIKSKNTSADIRLFTQEINPESYAICKAEMMIKGQREENVRKQDTFVADCFPELKARFVCENPPFGTPWGGKDAPDGDEVAVIEEYKKGFDGRWGAGLPGTSDGQLLFVQSAINKLDPVNGRAAIIENGSPLFTGGVSSGESQIRRWILEQDLLEAIIALPTDLFYNTGIATYIWILSKNKAEHRKGKVQLIDATTFFIKLRKNLGNKRVEIDPESRRKVTKLYAEFKENEYSKIFENEEFMYREYTVMQPLQRSYAITEERIDNLLSSGALNSLYDEAKVYELENSEDELSDKDQKKLQQYQENKPKFDEIITTLKASVSEKVHKEPVSFTKHLNEILVNAKLDKKLLSKIADGLSVMDKSAEIQKDKNGNVLYDKATSDTEIVKFKYNIDEYMAREVLPHVPDAKWFFEENLSAKKPVVKTGAEIPFTRYFYKYQQPEKSEVLAQRFVELEASISARINNLFNGD